MNFGGTLFNPPQFQIYYLFIGHSEISHGSILSSHIFECFILSKCDFPLFYFRGFDFYFYENDSPNPFLNNLTLFWIVSIHFQTCGRHFIHDHSSIKPWIVSVQCRTWYRFHKSDYLISSVTFPAPMNDVHSIQSPRLDPQGLVPPPPLSSVSRHWNLILILPPDVYLLHSFSPSHSSCHSHYCWVIVLWIGLYAVDLYRHTLELLWVQSRPPQ